MRIFYSRDKSIQQFETYIACTLSIIEYRWTNNYKKVTCIHRVYSMWNLSVQYYITALITHITNTRIIAQLLGCSITTHLHTSFQTLVGARLWGIVTMTSNINWGKPNISRSGI